MEAFFIARVPHEGTRHGVRGAQEFITKATEELQEARAMRGDRRPPPGAAPCPGEDDELHICINIPVLNGSTTQGHFWPSRAGRCEGPPHSYIRMPFGLPNAVATFQCRLRSIVAVQEARYHMVLAKVATALREPQERPEVQDQGNS